jgi:hypothetical protein
MQRRGAYGTIFKVRITIFCREMEKPKLYCVLSPLLYLSGTASALGLIYGWCNEMQWEGKASTGSGVSMLHYSLHVV